MAVIYLGNNNNKARKIKAIYYGVDNKAKEVHLGYYNYNYFYTRRYEVYLSSGVVRLSEFSTKTIPYMLESLTKLENKNTADSPLVKYNTHYDAVYNRTLIVPLGTTSIYLNKNSSKFYSISGQPLSYNIFANKLKFDLVENLSQFVLAGGRGLNGNISNINISNAINMHNAFKKTNIYGNYVCGDKVTDLSGCYEETQTLYGPFACGASVINMANTYKNIKIRGTNFEINIGPKVENMFYAYANIDAWEKVDENYLYANNVKFYGNNIYGCFMGTNIKGTIYLYNSSINFQDMIYHRGVEVPLAKYTLNIFINKKIQVNQQIFNMFFEKTGDILGPYSGGLEGQSYYVLRPNSNNARVRIYNTL